MGTKFSQKRIDHAKHSIKNSDKATLKRAIGKTAEAACDLIGYNIFDKITRVSKTSQKNNPETNKGEITRERYTSPEQR